MPISRDTMYRNATAFCWHVVDIGEHAPEKPGPPGPCYFCGHDTRVIGGRPLSLNPLPAVPYGDALCIGDGEAWIRTAMEILANGGTAEDLQYIPGTIVPSVWDGTIPDPLSVDPLPKHQPYLNVSHTEGHSTIWYVELARGCRSKCHYCGLGWSSRYREHSWGHIEDCIQRLDKSKSNRVTLFAPDEAAHPRYADALALIAERGFVTSFGSMRLDNLRKSGLTLPRNFLIRIGVDGLTEATRKRVGKRLTNSALIQAFQYWAETEHTSMKLFMMIGYPWERHEDFDEFEDTMEIIRSIRRKQHAHVRIKWTPLIPQARTPLADVRPRYDMRLIGRIRQWHKRVYRPRGGFGLYIEMDGDIMSKRRHRLQCELARGGVDTVARLKGTV